MKYSIVIPIHNEEGNIAPLHREILKVMDQLSDRIQYEIIYANDGSTDQSLNELKKLEHAIIINLRRRFGQSAAFDAGFKQALGDFIISMDGDGQNDPKDIPKLIEKQKEGFDVISGWRKKRKDPLMKRLVSQGANMLRKIFVHDNIHDSGCGLKLYTKESLKNLDLMGEMHRFIPGIVKLQGFRITEIEVNHRSRIHGKTKYNWKRTFKGITDMVGIWFWRNYANRPIHLFGTIGILTTFIGGAIGVIITILRIQNKIILGESNLPLFSVFLTILGIQFFISGLLADIMVKNYYQGKRRAYSIKEIIRN